MTNLDLEVLSEAVATKLGFSPTVEIDKGARTQWLHNDSERCFELMADHRINVAYNKHEVRAILINEGSFYQSLQSIDEDGDAAFATRVAILDLLSNLPRN
jgi:hypothetical protein